MNKEELIGKLQMVYVGDINALNELIGYYDGLKQGIEELQQENKKLNGAIQTYDILLKSNVEENKKLKDKLSKIETLIINHNCDTGDIYYKYNSRFLKSELKQRILEILYEEGSDSNEI